MGNIQSFPPLPQRFGTYPYWPFSPQTRLLNAVWNNQSDKLLKECRDLFQNGGNNVMYYYALWLMIEYELRDMLQTMVKWCIDNDNDGHILHELHLKYYVVYTDSEYRHVPMLRYYMSLFKDPKSQYVERLAWTQIMDDTTDLKKHKLCTPATWYNVIFHKWNDIFKFKCWRHVDWIATKYPYRPCKLYVENVVCDSRRYWNAARKIQRQWRRHQRHRLNTRFLWALTRSQYALSPEIARVVLERSRVSSTYLK
jgi:hypothetical protein